MHLASFHRIVSDVVAKHEGSIEEVHGDGIVIVFGHRIAHEDEPVRSVRCSLEIQEVLARFTGIENISFVARVAVHRGQYAINSSTSPHLKTIKMVGSASYIAARLQTVAPEGGVVISQALHKLVADEFDARSLGLFELKGVAAPMEVFVVDKEAVPKPIEVLPLGGPLGRNREIRQIMEFWEGTKAGKGNLILIVGQAGIGKTMLANFIRDRIAESGYMVYKMRCSNRTTRKPFDPFLELLGSFAPINAENNDGHGAWNAIHIDGAMARQHPLDSEIVSYLFADRSYDEGRQFNDADRSCPKKARVIAAFVRFIQRISAIEPVAIVFEDIHWIDQSSLELVDQWINSMSLSQVLIIATCRNNPREDWKFRDGVQCIQLSPLQREDASSMILRSAHNKLLPLNLQDLITEAARGNPLYLKELTRMMIEIEPPLLSECGHTWIQVRPFEHSLIPATVEDAIIARIVPHQVEIPLLQAAAALGDSFAQKDLESLFPALLQDIPSLLHRAVLYGIVLLDEEENLYHFTHGLVRKAIYQMMGEADRHATHKRIIESGVLAGSTCHNPSEMLAHHYYHAALYKESIVFWQEAAQHAILKQALSEASSHLGYALDALERLSDCHDLIEAKIEILQRRAPILMAVDGWASPSVGATCNSLLSLLSDSKKANQRFWVKYGLWAHQFVRGALVSAIDLANDLRSDAVYAGCELMLLAAQNALSYTHCYRGEFRASILEAEYALPLITSENDLGVAARFHLAPSVPIYAALAKSKFMLGFDQEAFQILDKARDWASNLNHVPSLATSISTQLDVSCWQRDWVNVEHYAMELLDVGQASGLAIWRIFSEMMLARVRLALHESSGNADDVLRWTTLLRQNGTGFETPSTSVMVCEALMIQDNPEAALEMCQLAEVFSLGNNVRLMLPELFRVKSRVLAMLGRHQEAFSANHRALSLCAEQDIQNPLLWPERLSLGL